MHGTELFSQFDLISLISFALITTYTPGPNNISSASMGLNYGYQKTFRYLLGIFAGFFTLMIVCAFISKTVLQVIPQVKLVLQIVGSLYIVWLAYHTFMANYQFEQEREAPLGFFNGYMLQLLNPKALVYGITIYSTFLSEVDYTAAFLIVSALIFAALSFSAISVWTLFGAFIRKFMNNPVLRLTINIILSLLLLYTAVSISGLIS